MDGSGNYAALHVLALRHAPEGLARSLLGPLVEEDARLEWCGAAVALAGQEEIRLEDASFTVFDLETTGLSHASARICEIGAARVERLEATAVFETLVSPGVPLPAPIGRLTGLTDAELRRAPKVAAAVTRFRAFAGDSVLVAHNARFDVGFVNRELERMTGKRLSGPVVDTVHLARNLLRGRIERTSLSSLAFFFGTSVTPCHRALADAQATAEVLLRLIGLAQERGARTVADLEELAAPSPGASTASGGSRTGHRRTPAFTSSGTGSTRCSTSARRGTSRAACARTSRPAASVQPLRRRSARSSASNGVSADPSWPPHSTR